MARFRLRFLLQEIDLPQGDTLIGRSANCQVTLDDPLVSREHARIRIADGVALLEDLRSRNGVRVGGRPISAAVKLANGDRVRVGTQELVFLELPAAAEPRVGGGTRQTGFMCHCAGCSRTYPAELVACPSCGSRERLDEDTLTGTNNRDFALELAAEAIERVRGAGTLADIERVLSHARTALERRLAESQPVERRFLDALCLAAGEVALGRAEAAWGRWALSMYASLGLTPPATFSERLEGLSADERFLLKQAAERAFESANAKQPHDDQAGLSALARLARG